MKVYTDGSCVKNGKAESKGGIGVYFETGKGIGMGFEKARDRFYDNYTITEKIGVATNNKCELLAILIALEECKDMLKNGEKIEICSDSRYSINCCINWSQVWEKNEWKSSTGKDVLNKQIIKTIRDEFIHPFKGLITFTYFPSHTPKPHVDNPKYKDWFGNFEADRLACYKN